MKILQQIEHSQVVFFFTIMVLFSYERCIKEDHFVAC
jgi:hypothetical protein